jgi:hypothetical protein
MTEALRLADALENTPNWQKESFGLDWKSGTMTFDRTPFDAAAELRRLHELNAELVEALRIIAGEKPCIDNLLSNADIARAALAKVDK